MSKITNRAGYYFDPNRIYIADVGDDNAQRMILREARPCSYSISSDGKVTTSFSVAGELSAKQASELTIYASTDAYKTAKYTNGDEYGTVKRLLEQIGISPCYEVAEDRKTLIQYVSPSGYFVNDSTVIERADFPDPWVISYNAENGKWEHNANFNGSVLYQTPYEILVDHEIRLLKFDNSEVVI